MKKVDSSVFMDCHDFASAKSRNDRKKAFLCKKDSRHCGTPKEVEMVFFKQSTDSKICGNRKNAENVFFNHAQRRKDFEARIGVLQGERGDKAVCLSHKQAEAIHDSSPKANAKTKQRRLNGQSTH